MTTFNSILRAIWRPAAAAALITLVATGCASTVDPDQPDTTQRSIGETQNPADTVKIK